jgi:hypothetical protein
MRDRAPILAQMLGGAPSQRLRGQRWIVGAASAHDGGAEGCPSHYGKSSKSSWASRSASASIVKNRGLAFQAILPLASSYRMASPRSWYWCRIRAISYRLVSFG